jgi:N-acetylglucosamine kinase-like BadF-type ATPase
MEYLIGIDSGGTKSEIKAYDLNSNIIYDDIGGFGNPCVNYDETLFNVTLIIQKCLNELGSGCKMIGVGMAAVETGNYAEKIKNEIENNFNIPTVVLNDAEMTCKAYFGNEDGIIAIAGTGSSCFVQKNGQGEMIGGWSHILGDEGSGYHTVIEAFKKIIYKYERNIPYDNLSCTLLKKIGGNTRADIMDFIYSNQKNNIASLFKIIVDLSKIKDEDSILLLENAGRFLANITITAYEKKQFNNEIKIGLKGGVFHNSNIVVTTFKNQIQNKINNFVLIEEDISATKGILKIYFTK